MDSCIGIITETKCRKQDSIAFKCSKIELLKQVPFFDINNKFRTSSALEMSQSNSPDLNTTPLFCHLECFYSIA